MYVRCAVFAVLTLAVLFLSGCPDEAVVTNENPLPGDQSTSTEEEKGVAALPVDTDTGTPDVPPSSTDTTAKVCYATQLDGFVDHISPKPARLGVTANGSGVLTAGGLDFDFVDFAADGTFGALRDFPLAPDEAWVASDGSLVFAGTDETPKGVIQETDGGVELLNMVDAYVVAKMVGDEIAWTVRLPGRVEAESFSAIRQLLTAIALTPQDGVLVVGTFTEALVLGAGEENQVVLGTEGDLTPKVFIAEYSSTGAFMRAVETNLAVAVTSVAIQEETGDIFLLGTDLRDHPEGENKSVVTARLDSEGVPIWVNDAYFTASIADWDGMNLEQSKLHLLPDGAFYIAGEYLAEMVVSDRLGRMDRLTTPVNPLGDGVTHAEYFVAYFDSEGALQWSLSNYTDQVETGHEVAAGSYSQAKGSTSTLLYGDQLVVAGNVVGTVVFNTSSTKNTEAKNTEFPVVDSAFIAAYGRDRETVWIKTLDGALNIDALTTSPDNALLLTGTFADPVTVTTTTGETKTLVPEEGGVGVMLAKICE